MATPMGLMVIMATMGLMVMMATPMGLIVIMMTALATMGAMVQTTARLLHIQPSLLHIHAAIRTSAPAPVGFLPTVMVILSLSRTMSSNASTVILNGPTISIMNVL